MTTHKQKLSDWEEKLIQKFDYFDGVIIKNLMTRIV